jgi:hypothetical protein
MVVGYEYLNSGQARACKRGLIRFSLNRFGTCKRGLYVIIVYELQNLLQTRAPRVHSYLACHGALRVLLMDSTLEIRSIERAQASLV